MILNVIVPYYNIEFSLLNRCLKTIMLQSYKHVNICFVDDGSSTHETFDLLVQFCQKSKYNFHNMKAIYNRENFGTIVSIKNAIEVLNPSDVDPIVIIDGDDSLFSNDVFTTLNDVYQNQNVYATFGNYVERNRYNKIVNGTEKNGKIYSYVMSKKYNFLDTIMNNKIREKNSFLYSHIKTFRYYLFRQINDEDFKKNGKYLKSATDVAIMLPICEMAGSRLFFIKKILYNYYIDNTDSHHNNCNRKKEQKSNRNYLFQLSKYSPVHIPQEIFDIDTLPDQPLPLPDQPLPLPDQPLSDQPLSDPEDKNEQEQQIQF